MQTLTPSYHHFFLHYATVAHIYRTIGYILKQSGKKKNDRFKIKSKFEVVQFLPWRIRFANVRVLIPSAIWIVYTSQTVIVSAIAHNQIHLFDSIIGSDVKCLVLFRYFHYLNGFAGGYVKNIEQN